MTWSPLTPGTNNTVASGTTLSATSGPVSLGDTINVALTAGQTGLVPASCVVTDNLGNIYSNTSRSNSNPSTDQQLIETWVSIATHAGTPTVQVQCNPTPGTTQFQNCSLNVDPFRGSDASSGSDGGAAQGQNGPGAGADAVSSGNFSTVVDGDLLYGASLDTSTGTDPGTRGTGFTDASISGGVVLHSVWKVQSVHSAATAVTFNATTGTDHFLTGGHAVKPAAAAGGAVGGFIAPMPPLW